MKKALLATVAVVALSLPSFAGTAVVRSSKNPVVPAEECFRAGEIQLDVFGLYNDSTGGIHQDGWGGGVGVNYFVTKYLGLGVEGNWTSAETAIHSAAGNVFFRLPVEMGHFCFAPYILGGGGGNWDGSGRGEGHIGGGLEFRFTPKVGLFIDGRHAFGGDNDHTVARSGVRVVF